MKPSSVRVLELLHACAATLTSAVHLTFLGAA
jgi:hypothetical protein